LSDRLRPLVVPLPGFQFELRELPVVDVGRGADPAQVVIGLLGHRHHEEEVPSRGPVGPAQADLEVHRDATGGCIRPRLHERRAILRVDECEPLVTGATEAEVLLRLRVDELDATRRARHPHQVRAGIREDAIA
jgi:hypothetical protein